MAGAGQGQLLAFPRTAPAGGSTILPCCMSGIHHQWTPAAPRKLPPAAERTAPCNQGDAAAAKALQRQPQRQPCATPEAAAAGRACSAAWRDTRVCAVLRFPFFCWGSFGACAACATHAFSACLHCSCGGHACACMQLHRECRVACVMRAHAGCGFPCGAQHLQPKHLRVHAVWPGASRWHDSGQQTFDRLQQQAMAPVGLNRDAAGLAVSLRHSFLHVQDHASMHMLARQGLFLACSCTVDQEARPMLTRMLAPPKPWCVFL